MSPNDLNERLSHLERCQSKNTGIKDDVSEFQEKFKLESEVNQTEHEDIEEDQIAENLTTKFNMEDKSDKDQSIELGNQSTVLMLAQEDLFTEVPHIDFIFGDEQ